MSEDGTQTGVGQQPKTLVRAIKYLLRPLVRFLLTRGITYPILSQWLKSIYIDVADKDFALPDKPQTDSRINLLTGIHRKDVKRLRGEPEETAEAPKSVSLGALLVARWTGMKQYLDDDSHPVALPRQPEDDSGISFEELVSSVNKDIRPRVVLDEWLRLGIVSIDEENRVHLNTAAFVPQKGMDELAFYFGRNLHDHIAAASHNLDEVDKRHLDRSVYYDQLSPESVEELEQMARDQGMEVLQAVNRRAMELQEKDRDTGSGSGKTAQRINFGVYCYSASDTETPEENS